MGADPEREGGRELRARDGALPGAGLRRAKGRLRPLGGGLLREGHGRFPVTPEEKRSEGALVC